MTFLGKALEIEKEKGSGMNIFQIMQKSCPSDYGFKDVECIKDGTAVVCMSCWNREMPNTEPKDEIKERLELIDELKQIEYNKGLNDAWELAKKVREMVSYQREEIFGTQSDLIIFGKTPQEALAKLKAYEEEQNKIEIGDVITYAGDKGLVLDCPYNKFLVLTNDGWIQEWYECDVEKTGKHIDIQSILEQIGE